MRSIESRKVDIAAKREARPRRSLLASADQTRASTFTPRSAIGSHPKEFPLIKPFTVQLTGAPRPLHDDNAVAHVHEFLGVSRGNQYRMAVFAEIGPDLLDLFPCTN